MFRIHMLGKMLGTASSDNSGQQRGEPQPAPPGAHGNGNGNGMPEQIAHNLKTQGDAMIQYGARLLVIRELLYSLVVALPPAERASAQRRFCLRIDQLLSLTDDHVLPAEFHTALLAEVNYYLGELKKT